MNKAVKHLTVTINQQAQRLQVAPGEKLIDTLRRHGYKSVKFGCGEGTCGSCTVLVDGRPHLACLTFTRQMEGRQITTLEGLGRFGELHPLQQAFLQEGAVQCGYCTPGMILSSHALLARDPDPSEEAIRRALDGNKCRCTGYAAIIRAVRRAARIQADATPSPRARRAKR